jgi:hypothetical protein
MFCPVLVNLYFVLECHELMLRIDLNVVKVLILNRALGNALKLVTQIEGENLGKND